MCNIQLSTQVVTVQNPSQQAFYYRYVQWHSVNQSRVMQMCPIVSRLRAAHVSRAEHPTEHRRSHADRSLLAPCQRRVMPCGACLSPSSTTSSTCSAQRAYPGLRHVPVTRSPACVPTIDRGSRTPAWDPTAAKQLTKPRPN